MMNQLTCFNETFYERISNFSIRTIAHYNQVQPLRVRLYEKIFKFIWNVHVKL